jgi:MarR family 2-MHQ and catechol resistance regulon transcriptional repressor
MEEKLASHHDETYNSITATYKLMQRKIAGMLSGEGLTQPQFHVLRIAAKSGGTSIREISDEMLVTPANMTGIIDRLESRGLIRREARKGDRRAKIIGLTPKGRAMQEEVAAKYSEFMEKSLRVLTKDEQRTLSDVLVKLQEGMSQSGG